MVKTVKNNFIYFLLSLVYLLNCIFFLGSQSLWVDETTQLTGLSLGFIDQLGWLLHFGDDYGVPFDRMPPLSYWFGNIWLFFFPFSTVSLRYLSIFYGFLSLLILVRTANRFYGKFSAIFAGLIFALSPNIIFTSLQIRPYSLFLLLTLCSLYFFLDFLHKNHSLSLYKMIGCVVLAAYSHFYGVILGCSLLVYLYLFKRNEKKWNIIILFFVSLVGLIPFVLSATGISSPPLNPPSFFISIVKLLYRLNFHSSFLIDPSAFYLACLGIFIVFSSSFSNFRSNENLKLLLVGLFLISISFFIVKSFNTAHAGYNIWMVPLFILFLSSFFKEINFIKIFSACCILCSFFYASYQLQYHQKYYSNGHYENLSKWLKDRNISSVVYNPNSSTSGIAYYTLSFLEKDYFQQFRINEKKEVSQFLQEDYKPIENLTASCDKIALVDIKLTPYKELINAIQLKKSPFSTSPISFLKKNEGWEVVEEKEWISWNSIKVTYFKKK